ncbi:hypothetical protein LTR17_012567 [Elasticomyces elasticus]|nr:hypothetical protein LTR17_012567 [Elasticomyces elasticus]
MATQTALDTIELLEAILAHLDFFELLAVRAVSKHWTSVIERSPTLKRLLFIAATSKDYVTLDIAASTKGTHRGAALPTKRDFGPVVDEYTPHCVHRLGGKLRSSAKNSAHLF